MFAPKTQCLVWKQIWPKRLIILNGYDYYDYYYSYRFNGYNHIKPNTSSIVKIYFFLLGYFDIKCLFVTARHYSIHFLFYIIVLYI